MMFFYLLLVLATLATMVASVRIIQKSHATRYPADGSEGNDVLASRFMYLGAVPMVSFVIVLLATSLYLLLQAHSMHYASIVGFIAFIWVCTVVGVSNSRDALTTHMFAKQRRNVPNYDHIDVV